MVIVEGTARIDESDWPAALAAMTPMIEASRAEEGCVEYAYSRDLLDPNLLRIIERWKDREALAYHFSTPHMATFRSALTALKPKDLSVRMYEAEPEALPG